MKRIGYLLAMSGFCLLISFFTSLTPDSRGNSKESFLDQSLVIDCKNNKIITFNELVAEVCKKNIIYVLEHHGIAFDHQLQKEIIKRLLSHNPSVVLAGEYWYKNTEDQKYLELYRYGAISSKEFRQHTDCDTISLRDGTSQDIWNEIQPLFNLIPDECLRCLAINITRFPVSSNKPIAISSLRKKICSGGFESLNDEEKKYFPLDGFRGSKLDSENLRVWITSQFEEMLTAHGSLTTDILYTSYWIMNEVIANSILDFFNDPNNQNYQMVVATGSSHGIFKSGIRASVAARRPDLEQTTILPLSKEEIIKIIRQNQNKNFTLEDMINFITANDFADYIII